MFKNKAAPKISPWWLATIGALVALQITVLLGYVIDFNVADAAFIIWPITVVLAVTIVMLFGRSRSMDAVYVALAATLGLCLLDASIAVAPGPGGGTGLWVVGRGQILP